MPTDITSGLDTKTVRQGGEPGPVEQEGMATARAPVPADEPTENQDASTSEAIMGLFETLGAEGKSIVTVTQITRT